MAKSIYITPNARFEPATSGLVFREMATGPKRRSAQEIDFKLFERSDFENHSKNSRLN